MSRLRRLILVTATLGTVLTILSPAGCEQVEGFHRRLNSIVRPYRFSILRWDLDNIAHGAEPLTDGGQVGAAASNETETVLEYFSLSDEIRALETEINTTAAGESHDHLASQREELAGLQETKRALSDAVQLVVGRQIKETLTKQSIYNPADRHIGLKIGFPPINFRLQQPPNLLVVSPRDRIESVRRIMLIQEISLDAVEDIEARVDDLDVSGLVVELGGFGGTYPTFVADDASLQFTVEAATEEWLHQYLAFTPLGFMYLLDLARVSRDYDIVTMNETLASIVSKEIGEAVLESYYPQYAARQDGEETARPGFDFGREMREIRIGVDGLLANGEIQQAEDLMEERRQYLASKGYYIRKLNQAYFAFHGAYADEPTSVSPIGAEMRELRSRSASLKEFLNAAAAMTSHRDLEDSLKTNPH